MIALRPKAFRVLWYLLTQPARGPQARISRTGMAGRVHQRYGDREHHQGGAPGPGGQRADAALPPDPPGLRISRGGRGHGVSLRPLLTETAVPLRHQRRFPCRTAHDAASVTTRARRPSSARPVDSRSQTRAQGMESPVRGGWTRLPAWGCRLGSVRSSPCSAAACPSPSAQASLDLDALHQQMRRLSDLARQAVQQYGGTLLPVVGDRCLALFGALSPRRITPNGPHWPRLPCTSRRPSTRHSRAQPQRGDRWASACTLGSWG